MRLASLIVIAASMGIYSAIKARESPCCQSLTGSLQCV